MVAKLPAIKWDKNALDQLEHHYKYIRKDSIKNAEKVKTQIIALINAVAAYPEKISFR